MTALNLSAEGFVWKAEPEGEWGKEKEIALLSETRDTPSVSTALTGDCEHNGNRVTTKSPDNFTIYATLL